MRRIAAISLLSAVVLSQPGAAHGQARGAPDAAVEAPTPGDADADADDPRAPATADGDDEALALDEEQPYEPRETPSSTLPTTVCNGRRVRRLVVLGARRVAEDDVLATMDTRRGETCRDATVTRDVRAIWDLGFFDDVSVEGVPGSGGAIDLVVKVVERPAIGRIAYEGNDELDDEDLDEKLTLEEGEILSVPEVEQQVLALRDLYAEKGFFLARVEYRLVRLDDGDVEIRFQIREGSEVAVRRVRFVGNRNIASSELRSFMQTSETGFFSFISSNDTFDRDKFDEDVNRLQALYYDRGFLTVSVGTPRIELTPDRRFIDVTIPIEEGPRFKIGRLRVQELGEDGDEIDPIGGRRTVREMIDTEPGDWFSRTRIAEGLQAITRHYRDHGYARVDMVPETDLDVRERIVHVTLSVRRGPLVHIERIHIRGNSKTRDSVIRRELQIAEGDTYNQTAVELSKARVTQLGYFKSVDVAEEAGAADDGIVLTFEVVEQPTGTFQVGAGFSSIESFLFTAQITQQNFLGNGQSLQLQLQLSGIRQLAQIQLIEPYLFGTDWTGDVSAFKTIRQFETFERDSTGGALRIGHPVFDNRLRFSVQYRADFVDVTSRTGGFFGSGSARGLNILQLLPVANLFRDGLTSSVRFGLTWDSRDNRMFPRLGVFASASTEVADSFLASKNVFVRHEAFARFYYPIFGNLILRLNTEWGLITSRQDQGVVIFERYYLGGIFNVRGFRLNSLGPRLGICNRSDPNCRPGETGIPIGGNMQFFYNLELEFPILETVGIKGVVFTDGGNAWNTEDQLCQAGPARYNDPAADPCRVDPLDLRTSWGFGIRWVSPLGPLRFEWGVPFSPRRFEQDVRFEFTIGQPF